MVYRTALPTYPSVVSPFQVTVDDAQIAWFEDLVESHPASEGWRVIVFTHG